MGVFDSLYIKKASKRGIIKNRDIKYRGLDSIKNALVFWNYNEHDEPTLTNFIKILKSNKVNVDIICFVPKGINVGISGIYEYFTTKEISPKGKILKSDVLEHLKGRFDIAIDLTYNNHTIASSLYKYIDAGLIIAKERDDCDADIMISDINDFTDITDKIEQFLKKYN